MNLGDIDIQSVHYHQPRLQHSPSRHSITVGNEILENQEGEYESEAESARTEDTIIRWTTPPQSPENPQQEQHQLRSGKYDPSSEPPYEHTDGMGSQGSNDTLVPPALTLDEAQRKLKEAAGRVRVRMEDFSGPPTPQADDGPYVRFAIEQLTRDEDVIASQRPLTGDSDESYPVERIVPDHGLGYMQSIKRVRRPSMVEIGPKGSSFPIQTPPLFRSTPPFQSNLDRASEYIATKSKSELFIPVRPEVNSPRYPDLTWVPKILGGLSMSFLVFSSLLMIAALITSAIYSMTHSGLTKFNGRIYGGQYFLFQILPQILAAVILFYIEAVMTAVARLVPFTMMASDDSRRRNHGLFMGLYPRSLLFPRFDYFPHEPLLGVCSLMLWPIMFTIPLQSCLFSVALIDGTWRWTAVLGVAWALVAIYIMALISLIGIAIYFFHRPTGLIWDPRSIADIIALLPRSNNLDEYQNTEVLRGKAEMEHNLIDTSARLGYWKTLDGAQDLFYCIGESGRETRKFTIQGGKTQEKTPIYDENHTPEFAGHSPQPLVTRGTDSSLLAKVYSPAIRFRYIPWFLNETFILLWPIAAFFLLLALIIVSFLPSTAIRNGFKPQVPAAPNSGGFSPANFLYSFVPSLLGLFLYSALRGLTHTLYLLAPWAALSRPAGAVASQSLLLDYPFSSTLSNIATTYSNGHFILTLLALVSPLMILLPILSGGLFFALISPAYNNEIRMLPNLPAYYILLTLLILYLFALVCITTSLLFTYSLGSRNLHHYLLPHPVMCLAEIISFLYASGLVHDAAFRAVRSKADLRARLVGRRERVSMESGRQGSLARGNEVRYFLGIFKGRDGRSHLGVSRVGSGERDFTLGVGGRGASMSRFSV